MLTRDFEEQLCKMDMSVMAEAIRRQISNPEQLTLGIEDIVSNATDEQWQDRETKRIERMMKSARLPMAVTMEDIDFTMPRVPDKRLLSSLTSGRYISEYLNISITGPTGTGKTHIASVLGQEAIHLGHTVLYYRFPTLIEDFNIAHREGDLRKLGKKLVKPDVLILDDYGMAPMSEIAQYQLYEIVCARHENSSTIITSMLPVDDWYTYLGHPLLAEATMDRFLKRSHPVVLEGRSKRQQVPQNLNHEKVH